MPEMALDGEEGEVGDKQNDEIAARQSRGDGEAFLENGSASGAGMLRRLRIGTQRDASRAMTQGLEKKGEKRKTRQARLLTKARSERSHPRRAR